MAERTGCPVFLSLWSYVTDITLFGYLYRSFEIENLGKMLSEVRPLYFLHTLPLVTNVFGLMIDDQTYP